MDLEASSLVVTVVVVRGLPMRLANDWELLEAWSSVVNLARCVLDGALLLPDSGVNSLDVDERRVE